LDVEHNVAMAQQRLDQASAAFAQWVGLPTATAVFCPPGPTFTPRHPVLFLRRVVDKLFASFCAKIGVANIRQYEEERLGKLQERTKQREEYSKQLARLQAQLEFQREAETARTVTQHQQALKEAHARLDSLRQEQAALAQVVTEETAKLEQARAEEQSLARQVSDQEIELNEHKKALLAHAKGFNAIQKVPASVSTGRGEQGRAGGMAPGRPSSHWSVGLAGCGCVFRSCGRFTA
jgi:hypothetical protein